MVEGGCNRFIAHSFLLWMKIFLWIICLVLSFEDSATAGVIFARRCKLLPPVEYLRHYVYAEFQDRFYFTCVGSGQCQDAGESHSPHDCKMSSERPAVAYCTLYETNYMLKCTKNINKASLFHYSMERFVENCLHENGTFIDYNYLRRAIEDPFEVVPCEVRSDAP